MDHSLAQERPAGSKEAQKIAGGALIALVGGGLSFVLSIAYQIMVARALGKALVGVLALSLVVSNLLAEGSDLGLDYGVLRFGGIAHGQRDWGRFRSTLRSAIRGSLITGGVACVALAVGSTLVATMFNKPAIQPVLIPLAFAIPFTATTAVLRAGLRAMGNAVRPVASVSVVGPGCRLLTGIVAVSLFGTVQAVAVAFATTEVVVLVVTAVMLSRLIPPAEGSRLAPTKGLYRFSLPMSLNRILNYGNNQTEIIVLGFLASSAALGVFSVDRRLSLLLAALLTSMATLFPPTVAHLHHSGRTDELDSIFKAATRWVFTLGLPVCLFEVLFAAQILGLYGKDFREGALALAILALGQLVNVGTGTIASLQAMAGYAKTTLLNSLLFLSLSVALDLLLIPSFGIVGAAVANSTSLVTINVLRLWQVRRNLGVTPYDRAFLRPLAAAVPAGLVTYFVPLPDTVLGLLAHAAILGIVYLGALIALGFEPIDREIARSALARLKRRRLEPSASADG